MRKTKPVILTIVLVMAVLLAIGWAFARGSGGMKGYGYPGSWYGDGWNLSAEQREKLHALEERFHQDTVQLRRQLYQKGLDLQALWADPKTDPEKIKAKQSEVFELQRELREKALEHRLAMREVLPQEYFGQGPRGYGHHHGWGHMGRGPGFNARQGYGGGPCW